MCNQAKSCVPISCTCWLKEYLYLNNKVETAIRKLKLTLPMLCNSVKTKAKTCLLLSILHVVWHDSAVRQTVIQSSSFFLSVLWSLTLPFSSAWKTGVMNFLTISPAAYEHFTKIQFQENILLCYNLPASYGTSPGSFTGTENREARIQNLRFGSVWLQMEVHVLHSCRKFSGLHSHVRIPAICASPISFQCLPYCLQAVPC